MKNHSDRLWIAVMVMALSAAAVSAQPQALLTVEVNRPKAQVSPTLYGLMTEEINYSYDGGLYAELIRNRTFRSDWSGILNWYLIEKGSSSAKLTVDNGDGPSAALRNSAKIKVTKADNNSPAGLLNEGYWGMAVRPNTRYSGSFYAKSSSESPLPVRIALVADQSGEVLGSASVDVTGAAWKQYKFDLRSGKAAASAENLLELTIARPATLWLQLFRCCRPHITAEQAAPHCKDPRRLPDSSTVRRWAQRRLVSLWCWVKAGVKDQHFLHSPTILAWDLGALCRILPIEARSP